MRDEPVPLYKAGDSAHYKGEPIVFLAIQTYCSCCDRFYDEAKYSIKAVNNEWVKHRIPESEIEFYSED